MTVPAEYRFERKHEWAEAIEAIDYALTTVEDQHREPDQWERALLREAVGWLFRGGYRLAVVEADAQLR